MNTHLFRRRLCLLVTLTVGGGFAWAAPQPITIDVWKSPSCGCCADWIRHLEDSGFHATVHETGNNNIRRQLGMPTKFGACHTARVSGYVIEGHVPAREVRRLLSEKPAAIGIAVPGMPIGSPGMDGRDYGGRKDPYDVLLVEHDGSSRVFQSYR